MKFYKYHAAGNDFVLVDNSDAGICEKEKPRIAKKVCDRKFGIGGDGFILVEKSSKCDAKMRIFNPDGSEVEMCGNGIRCVAKYLFEKKGIKKKEISVQTIAGQKKAEVYIKNGEVKSVLVNIGDPEFERSKIPALGKGKLIKEKIKVGKDEVEISAVNTGVPHAVIFVDDVDKANILKIGRMIRHHALFPLGTNVNFVQKMGKNFFKVRTYERGVEGETLACGTGVAACGAVASLLGLLNPKEKIKIKTKGGTFYLKFEKGICIEGPVSFVFEGLWK